MNDPESYLHGVIGDLEAERDTLKAENERLKAEFLRMAKSLDSAVSERDSLAKEVQKMREALEKISDIDEVQCGTNYNAWSRCKSIAKNVLAEGREGRG